MITVLIWVVVVLVVLIVGGRMIPELGTLVASFADESSAVVLMVAPKVAILAAGLGLLISLVPKFKAHGHHLLKWAILTAIFAGLVSVGLPWLGEQGSSVGQSAMQVAGSVIQQVLAGLRAGIG